MGLMQEALLQICVDTNNLGEFAAHTNVFLFSLRPDVYLLSMNYYNYFF